MQFITFSQEWHQITFLSLEFCGVTGLVLKAPLKLCVKQDANMEVVREFVDRVYGSASQRLLRVHCGRDLA